jgi:hypothetical protein
MANYYAIWNARIYVIYHEVNFQYIVKVIMQVILKVIMEVIMHVGHYELL